MIPIVNQGQGRTGPSLPPAARAVDAVGPVIAHANSDIPPVDEAAPTSEDVQLGREGIERARSSDTDPAIRQRTKSTVDDSRGSQDHAVFRAKVIKFLSAMYSDDEAFMRALKLGTLVVRAVEDQPDPEMRPELVYATYKEGAAPAMAEMAARRGAAPVAVGPNDFVAWWPK